MLECPSCKQALPASARFCNRCGERLPEPVSVAVSAQPDKSTTPTVSLTGKNGLRSDINVQENTLLTTATLVLPRPQNGIREQLMLPFDPHLEIDEAAGPFAHTKRELTTFCRSMLLAMEALLPYVYDDHREENRQLFTNTLADIPALDDSVWGRVAFVVGAYGNYMYRYPLDAQQKQTMWQALLWATYYERCYRRKYLAQRTQQLLHFFLGCQHDTAFLVDALVDLDRLIPFLEINSLKKVLDAFQRMPEPPALLQTKAEQELSKAEERKLQLEEEKKQQAGQKHLENRLTATETKKSVSQDSTISKQATQGSETQPFPGPSEHIQPVVEKVVTDELAPGIRLALSFLRPEQCVEFSAHLRHSRLEALSILLRSARGPLLTALVQELNASEDLEYQPPRRTIRLGRKNNDRFSEALRLLTSQNSSDQQTALRMFDLGARETTHRDYAPLAREWLLYARALVQGGPRAADHWESTFQQGEASWEEIGNLAAFYLQNGYPAEALRVLRPGLDALRAPISHVRMALHCAIRLLLEPVPAGQPVLPAQKVALNLLLNHLEHWPHPLCYLAMLVLATEVHGPLHPRKQAQLLSTFQELAERPVTLPDPRKELHETRMLALQQALIEKARATLAWYFWLNDYAERHPHKYQAWMRLAEVCEQLARLEQEEQALQHLVEIQYRHDYANYKEGAPQPRAEYLRGNLIKLFEFYQRHHLTEAAEEAFNSCYPSLSHLWEARDAANLKLIELTRPYLDERHRRETQHFSAEVNPHESTRTRPLPALKVQTDRRVGIFVDYENIAHLLPAEADVQTIANALVIYGEHYGAVVCCWASASPQNLSNLADVRMGLEDAGFKVRFPRRELQFSLSRKNLADFALLECLSEAQAMHRPDVYLIVSGDRDYYERICSLLDAGHTVRIIAAAGGQHLSQKYRELAQKRNQEQLTDFYIDNLEDIV